MSMNLGPLGLAVDISADDQHLHIARRAEQVGFGTVWVAGGQLDRLAVLTDLLAATDSIRVGASIISLGVHTPADVDAVHASAAASHPGRLVVGLGSPQAKRSLEATRAALTGLDVPVPDRLLAALGPRKLELARELTAGAITLLVTREHTAQARDALGPDRTLVVDLPVVLDDDPARARDTARGMIGFLLGVAGYRANFARMGFTEDQVESMADPLVDAVVAHGDVDAIGAAIGAHRRAGADHVMLTVLGDADPIDTVDHLARAMVGP